MKVFESAKKTVACWWAKMILPHLTYVEKRRGAGKSHFIIMIIRGAYRRKRDTHVEQWKKRLLQLQKITSFSNKTKTKRISPKKNPEKIIQLTYLPYELAPSRPKRKIRKIVNYNFFRKWAWKKKILTRKGTESIQKNCCLRNYPSKASDYSEKIRTRSITYN